MTKKYISLPEFLEKTKEGLKRIVYFEQQCLELRKKEAEKSLEKDDMALPMGADAPSQALMMSEDEANDPLCKKCSKLKKNCKCEMAMSKGTMPDDKPVLHPEGDEGSGGEPKKLGKTSPLKSFTGKGSAIPGTKMNNATVMSPPAQGPGIANTHDNFKPMATSKPSSKFNSSLGKADASMALKAPVAPKSPIGMSNPGGTPKGAVAKTVTNAGGSGDESHPWDVISSAPPPPPVKSKKGPPPVPTQTKKSELEKKHIGFNKLKNKVENEGYSEESAAKIAASVGDKKYGKHKMETAAHEGKPANKIKKSVCLPGKQKKSLPDMSGFKSLVHKDPKEGVAETNKQLSGGFKSLATNPTAGPKAGGGKVVGGFPKK